MCITNATILFKPFKLSLHNLIYSKTCRTDHKGRQDPGINKWYKMQKIMTIKKKFAV